MVGGILCLVGGFVFGVLLLLVCCIGLGRRSRSFGVFRRIRLFSSSRWLLL